MSVGNPKKFEGLSKIKKALDQSKAESKDALSKIYKDKNYEVKKALHFKTDADRSKLT